MQPQKRPTPSQPTTFKSSAIRLTDCAKNYNRNMPRRASDSQEEGDNIVVASRSRSEIESDAPISNTPGNNVAVAGDQEGADEGEGGNESSLSSGSPTDDYVSAPTGPQFHDTERQAILYLRRKYGDKLPPGIKWKITRRLNKWLRQVAHAHGIEPWQRSFNSWRLEFGKMKDEIAKVERNNEYARSHGHPEDIQPVPFPRPSRMPDARSFYDSRESTEEVESVSDDLEQSVDLLPEDPIQKIVDSWRAIPTDPNQAYALSLALQEEADALAELERNIRVNEGVQPRPVGPTPQAAGPARTVRFGGVEEREDSGRESEEEGEEEGDGEEQDDGLLDPEDML